MQTYTLYGLTIDSEFPLPAPPGTGPTDLTVRWGRERPIPFDAPAGNIVSEVRLGQVHYATSRNELGYVIRFPGRCDAVVDQGLNNVELVVPSKSERSFAEILFAGSILAKVLMLGGGCILHASAVATNGRAIAYVGPPGKGKSTLAALSCAAGGRLITDDVLRLTPQTDGWHCAPGTGQIRLRPQAAPIAPMLNGPAEETLDERISVALDLSAGAVLTALVFPRPSRAHGEVFVERLNEHDTFMQLTSFPRVLGWKDPQVLATSFRWNARLAREVPAFQADVPWGPPFDPSIASQLVDIVAERSMERA